MHSIDHTAKSKINGVGGQYAVFNVTMRPGAEARVLVDRIDPVEKKIQFAVFEEASPTPPRKASTRKSKKEKRKRPSSP